MILNWLDRMFTPEVVHREALTQDREWVTNFFSPCSTRTLEFTVAIIEDILEERRARGRFVDPSIA